MMHLSILRWN